MVDLVVALTWIAMSAVSAKGLLAFAHAAATTDAEAELVSLVGDNGVSSEWRYTAELLPYPMHGRR